MSAPMDPKGPPCPACKGTGSIWVRPDREPYEIDCEACHPDAPAPVPMPQALEGEDGPRTDSELVAALDPVLVSCLISDAAKKAILSRLSGLRESVAGLTAERDKLRAIRTELAADVKSARGERDALRKALEKYGCHVHAPGPMCESAKHSDYPCTCGLAEILAHKVTQEEAGI